MAGTKTFRAEVGDARLDKFLVGKLPSLSRSYLQKLITQGHVTVNDTPVLASGRLLVPGEKVVLTLQEFSGLPAAAAKTVPILFEDDHLVAVNKPVGWVVHPAGPHQTDTLIQRLWPKLSKAWGKSVKDAPLHTARPGVVHRLDRETSGVIIIAKTPKAAEALSAQFADRTTEKIYRALVAGSPGTDEGTIKSTVGRDRQRPTRMSVSAPGKPAELFFKVLARFPGDTLLEVVPKTGRTHQIRVQLAGVGHPLVGDEVYDGPPGSRPFLHALSLAFDHPKTKKRMRLTAPLAPDFLAELKKRGWKKND